MISDFSLTYINISQSNYQSIIVNVRTIYLGVYKYAIIIIIYAIHTIRLQCNKKKKKKNTLVVLNLNVQLRKR